MPVIEYRFSRFRLIPSSRELLADGRAVSSPRRVFDCLAYLLEHRDRAIGRDELVAAVWGRVDVSDVQLGQIVVRARRAVDDDGTAQHSIRTIAGFGYRWVATTDVVPVSTSAASASRADDERRDATRIANPAESAASETEVAAVRKRAPSARSPYAARVRGSIVAAAIAVTVLVLTLAAKVGTQRPEPAPVASAPMPAHPATALVLPLQTSGKPDNAWVRLGAMDLVANRLRTAGLSVPPSESVLAVLQTAGDSKAERLALLRRTFDVRLIVQGSAYSDGARWHFELHGDAVDGSAFSAAFEHDDAIHAARTATDTLLAAIGRDAPADEANRNDLEETWQRARAAMLANELDTARAILNGSAELTKAPLELAFRLAQVDFRAGKLDAADAALSNVLAHLTPQDDPLFRSRVLTMRGSTRVRRGEFAQGGVDFDAALSALPAGNRSIERGKALAGRGTIRIPAHRFDDALADLGEARIELAAAGDAFGTARVDANLGMLELYRGRPAAALDYLPRAAERLESFGALQEWQIAQTGLVEADLALLQYDAAWAAVEKSWALRARTTDPDQAVDIALNRAHVLARYGRYREAETLLADPHIDDVVNPVLRARALSLRAELNWRLGHWQTASDDADLALKGWPAEGADGERDWVGLIRQRALLANGKPAAAEKVFDRHATAGSADEAQTDSVYRALAEAEWLQTAGDSVRADRWFGRAMSLAERRGIPDEIATVVGAQVPVLLQRSRRDEARALAGRVAPWATRDFGSALVQLQLFHALGEPTPWLEALRQARSLAGERVIAAALMIGPSLDSHTAAPIR